MHPIAERRNVLGLSQEALAEAAGADRTTVWRWETYRTEPQPKHRRGLARALELTLDELGHLLDAARNENRPTRAQIVESWTHDGALLESPSAILDRLQRHNGAAITPEYLDGLSAVILDVTERYEMEGPERLAPELLRRLQHVHGLLGQCPPSRRGLELMRLAGKMTAQLAYMAVNVGDFPAAGAYAAEAFHLADEVGDDGLKAWVRGTQSFGAYYRKRYDDALDYAREGLRYAGDGPQAVRLAINGEARALGQLGDYQGAKAAMSRAYQLLEQCDPEEGMSSCISFDVYSEARVASNAATAWLALRRTDEALAEANRVLEVVDLSNSAWSKALVRLDVAGASLQGDQSDVERAVQLVREVRDLSRGNAVESIRQRTASCVASLRPWKGTPVVDDLLAEINEETRASAGNP